MTKENVVNRIEVIETVNTVRFVVNHQLNIVLFFFFSALIIDKF